MPWLSARAHHVRISAFTDVLSAGVAVLRIQRLVAGTAVWPTLSHDVALTTECRLTLKAAEVPHVPVASLRLRALICQNDLIVKRGGKWQGFQFRVTSGRRTRLVQCRVELGVLCG